MEKHLIVLTDERLDHLAERFRELRIRELTHATFDQYVCNSERFEAMARALRAGHGLQWVEGYEVTRVVCFG